MAFKNPWKLKSTGRRKQAVARAYLAPGKGEVSINNRNLEDYFSRVIHRSKVEDPFHVTQSLGKFKTHITVQGGGSSGQAEAIRHAISRALEKISEENRASLKKAGFLTRDARIVERKKYGQRGARRRFQYSKR